MTISDWELWACAQGIITQYGEDAAIHAAMKADTLLAGGDHAGSATWRQIVERINALNEKPEGALH